MTWTESRGPGAKWGMSPFPGAEGLPAGVLDGALGSARRLRLPAGTRVFAAGEACAGFPVVLEGSIRVAQCGAQGRELVLYRVGPGEGCILTSSCLLGDVPYTAEGVAETDTELLLLPRPAFLELLAHEPFRRFVFGLFAERLAELTALVDAVAFRRLDARLAERLLGHGSAVETTHQALAAELGTVREIVSRVLKQFEERGLVRLGRGRVEVLDAAGLRAIAELR